MIKQKIEELEKEIIQLRSELNATQKRLYNDRKLRKIEKEKALNELEFNKLYLGMKFQKFRGGKLGVEFQHIDPQNNTYKFILKVESTGRYFGKIYSN